MEFKRGQLRNFVTVAEDGQMTRAARKLHLAQPALSHSISQLESELGIVLLERHARGVTLTASGQAFLPKAQAALAASDDALRTAQSLARSGSGQMEVGYVGPPPLVNAPELFGVFVESNPDVSVSFREIAFPYDPTSGWLEAVDVAFTHSPASERGVCIQAIRAEPRAIVAPEGHALADRAQLGVAEVLDEVFLGYHVDVQPAWAAFHSLDDHRGAPAKLTADRARTPPEMLAMMASRQALAAVPLSDARVIQHVLRGVVAIPLIDADPAMLSLVWREGDHNPGVHALIAIAAHLARSNGAVTAQPIAAPRPSQ
ncbi:MAG TPA: LysR family transcriptional regulator [Solirubrobacteraceae bacterium]|jgi:DNA-binding transcriptional LysR family regulator|nr:LysR family transcriptional regulator [Solirubrobacteraceae bacterium]